MIIFVAACGLQQGKVILLVQENHLAPRQQGSFALVEHACSLERSHERRAQAATERPPPSACEPRGARNSDLDSAQGLV